MHNTFHESMHYNGTKNIRQKGNTSAENVCNNLVWWSKGHNKKPEKDDS